LLIHYRLDMPDRVKCSVCGGEAVEIEEEYTEGDFIMITYKCKDCGHIEKRQYGRPTSIID